MFSFGQQVKALPGKPSLTLIMSNRQPNHKYTEFMDFMRVHEVVHEILKGVLVWCFAGK